MRKFSLAIVPFILLLASMGSAQAVSVSANEYAQSHWQETTQTDTDEYPEAEDGKKTNDFDRDNTNLNAQQHASETGRMHANPQAAIAPAMAPVPVPAAAWLLVSGLIGMVSIARRRTK